MFDLRILWIFVFGLIGGVVAQFIGVPMPYMLGAIFGSACFVLWYEKGDRQLPKLTRWVRLIFMSVIGTMIGSRFTPELLVLLPQFWLSIAALLPFILLAHGGAFDHAFDFVCWQVQFDGHVGVFRFKRLSCLLGSPPDLR